MTCVIRSFRDTQTDRLFRRERVSTLARSLQHAALRKLLLLDAAESLEDLHVPPGNRLEKLAGDRKGQYSIRINDQYRVCFRWEGARRMTWKWSITIEGAVMPGRKQAPVHPGEILQEEFLSPLDISQYRLAKETSVPARRINEIVRGSRSISADTALRLARYFGTSERFWLNLQASYDLEVEKDRLGDRLRREVKVLEVANA
jgi:addiction module HigA family antidote